MACLVGSLYGRVWRRSAPSTVHFSFVAKERIAMAPLGTTRFRRGRASRWLAGATALALCGLAGAYWPPQSASAAGPGGGAPAPIPSRATLLPSGRYVRPAGIRYNLGDFSLGLAVAPNGRCAASSNEGWGNGRPVPAVPKVNRAGTEPDEGVTGLNLVTGATQFVTVNRKPAQNFMGIGLAYSHDGTRLYATSGGTDAVYQFNVGPDCQLTYAATVNLPAQAPPPGGLTGPSAASDRGLALSPDGTVLVTTEYGRALNAVSVDGAGNLTTAKEAVAFGTPTIVPHSTNILNFLNPPTPNDLDPSYLYAVATATNPATGQPRADTTRRGHRPAHPRRLRRRQQLGKGPDRHRWRPPHRPRRQPGRPGGHGGGRQQRSGLHRRRERGRHARPGRQCHPPRGAGRGHRLSPGRGRVRRDLPRLCCARG